jgi:aminoglycoside phosphotransferase (APT) family kinase protein
LGGALSARLITGGRSNLTYLVSTDSDRVVVRRPPVGHLLATAHDMNREYTVMSALRGTAVPVPPVLGHCSDDDVLGAPFYVMEFLPGAGYRHRSDLAPWGAATTRAVSERLVDILADLHAIEPAAIGLSGFGRPAGFLGRQLNRWRAQFESSYSRELPDMTRLHERLSACLPDDGTSGIVHGDYRLDNILVSARHELLAVVDWELATVGDTLTDLALMLVYHRVGDMAGGGAIADAASAPGFLAESEIIARYADRSGRRLDRLDFYLGLACFKLAGILEGIHHRHRNGQAVDRDSMGLGDDLTGPVLAIGLNSLKETY